MDVANDPFEAFKMPLSVSEGVEIPLGNTGAVFKCKLPSMAFEDYQARVIAEMPFLADADGKRQMPPADEMLRVRRKVFGAMCVISAKGLPNKMSVEDFFEAYPLALGEIHRKASRLAQEDDDRFVDAVGNLKSGSGG